MESENYDIDDVTNVLNKISRRSIEEFWLEAQGVVVVFDVEGVTYRLEMNLHSGSRWFSILDSTSGTWTQVWEGNNAGY